MNQAGGAAPHGHPAGAPHSKRLSQTVKNWQIEDHSWNWDPVDLPLTWCLSAAPLGTTGELLQ